MSSGRKISLKSSNGESFEVEEVVALESQTIKHMIEDDCTDNDIPLPNVTSKILAKVIEYCNKHVDAAAPNSDDRSSSTFAADDLKSWDADFVKVDQATLFDLIPVRTDLDYEEEAPASEFQYEVEMSDVYIWMKQNLLKHEV